MLTHNLLVTSGRDSLVVWDARLPDPVKVGYNNWIRI